MYEKRIEMIEQEITPFGIIDTGENDNTFVDGSGQVWQEENTQKYDFL
jgi:hypothetical protein